MPGATTIAREYSASTANEYVLVIDASVTEASSLGGTAIYQAATTDLWPVAKWPDRKRGWVKSDAAGHATWFQGQVRTVTCVRALYASDKKASDFDILIRRLKTGQKFVAPTGEGLVKTGVYRWVMYAGADIGLLADECDDESDRTRQRAIPGAKDIVTRLSTATEIGEGVAVELVVDQIRKQIHRGAEGYAVLNTFLEIVNPKRFPKGVLVAILVATAAAEARGLLPAHKGFFSAAVAAVNGRDGQHAAREVAAQVAEAAAQAGAAVAERAADIGRFIEEVYRLGGAGELQEATDKVFQYIDDILLAGEYSACDEIMRRVDAKRLPAALLRSFLSITAAVKDQLRYRSGFYREAFAEMVRLKGNETKAYKLLGRLA